LLFLQLLLKKAIERGQGAGAEGPRADFLTQKMNGDQNGKSELKMDENWE